jgi:hypothetical protein
MRAMDVQVLLLDEVHNILAGTLREQRSVLNTLRYLSNELKISLVCFGVNEAREAIGGAVQLARRFEEFPLTRWVCRRRIRDDPPTCTAIEADPSFLQPDRGSSRSARNTPAPVTRFPGSVPPARSLLVRTSYCPTGPPRNWGYPDEFDIFAPVFGPGGESMTWILRLVKTGTEGEDRGTDPMEIKRPDGLGDIANLGLTLSGTKLLLANVQQEILATQARDHVVRRPDCPHGGGVCHVKDYRYHAVATLFSQVTMKSARFRCARRGGTGIGWPSHCRSIPELDRVRAHLSALNDLSGSRWPKRRAGREPQLAALLQGCASGRLAVTPAEALRVLGRPG